MTTKEANPKLRMSALLRGMEKKYGVTKLIGAGASLEQCLFLILREGWDFKKASRAVRILESGFIDWNEVRVSSTAELDSALAFLKGTDMPARVKRLRDFLEAVMNEFSELSSDMFREMELEPLRRFLTGAPALGRANACMVLQLHANEQVKQGKTKPDEVLVIAPETMRVAIRLGVIKKTTSANLARKELLKVLSPRDYLRFQNMFVRHADATCLLKNQLCADCFMNGFCEALTGR